MDYMLRELDDPPESERFAILGSLMRFNADALPGPVPRAFAIMIDDAAGASAGGLWAVSAYDWLIVEMIFIPPTLRGQGLGAQLMARAEEVAAERGCIGIWLDTFSFQARGFYEKLGYSLAGTIEDHPIGGARYFLAKRLSPAPA